VFFYDYNQMTTEEISAKLGPAPKATSASALSAALSGRTIKLVLDDGPVLEYSFADEGSLTLVEDGAAAITGPYSALDIREVVLFSHMIPGTQRGYNVIINEKTNVATVFEVWFGGPKGDAREVQRQIYQGYVDNGAVIEARHKLTNRLEGKGLYWKDDRGVELLTFFPSVMYSSFVEISHPRGGITVCAPSDFIKINENLYIYSRVEAEFSGTMVLEVLELYSVSQIGVRLGFDEKDELDYILYRGKGEVTGQIATYEKLTDYGETLSLRGSSSLNDEKPKGYRPVYRPKYMHPDLTKEQVEEAIAKNKDVFSVSDIMSGKNDMDDCDLMIGKTFTLRFDNNGPAWEYEVLTIDTLKWRNVGEEEWHEERYKAFEPAENIVLFSHLHSDSPEHRNVTNAIDFSNGLVTCVDAHIGNERSVWEVGNCVHFGVLDMPGITPPGIRRHQFTDELVGKAFTWIYSEKMSSIHVYSSPESYSWTIFLENGAGGMMWSSPCFYVKLREDAYLFCWVEEKCNGAQGLMVFNPRLMHDAGYFFRADQNGLRLSTLGAYARMAGTYDINKYFELKNRN